MRKRHAGSEVFLGVFLPMCVLCLFGFFALFLSLYGGKVYKNLQVETDKSFQMTVAGNYVQTRALQNNRVGAISLTNQNGIETMEIKINTEEGFYKTTIYAYDGYLKENFSSIDTEFSPEDGVNIARMKSCSFSISANRLLIVQLESEDGLSVGVPVRLLRGVVTE